MRRLSLSLLLLSLALPALAQDAPVPPPPPGPRPPAGPLPKGPAPAPQPDTATVYIYRLADHYAAIDKPTVTLDQKDLLRIHRGTVFTLQMPAGPHILASNAKNNQLMIDAKPGETYYVFVRMQPSDGMHQPKGFLILMDPLKVNPNFKKLKPAVAENPNSPEAALP